MSLIINEIFHSIQGESLLCGCPCVFIRVSGCNLRCSYCDTRYAYEHGMEMEISEILDQVSVYKCKLVEVTGGEPLFQEQTPLLVSSLLENGYEVMMETNGTFDISGVDERCIKIVDIKCPGSGESEKNDLENLERLNSEDQIKFVIGTREDYEYAKAITKSKCSGISSKNILFSPESDKMYPAMLAKWILEDNIQVRLHFQLHKIIWPEIQRGI